MLALQLDIIWIPVIRCTNEMKLAGEVKKEMIIHKIYKHAWYISLFALLSAHAWRQQNKRCLISEPNYFFKVSFLFTRVATCSSSCFILCEYIMIEMKCLKYTHTYNYFMHPIFKILSSYCSSIEKTKKNGAKNLWKLFIFFFSFDYCLAMM